MHITLKEIGKILFALVVKTLLICKSLKFTAAFTEKIKLKFAFNLPCEKVDFSLINPTRINIHNF